MEEFDKKKRSPRFYWLIWLLTIGILSGSIIGGIYWIQNNNIMENLEEPQDFNEETDNRYTWDLSAMYKNDTEAQAALDVLEGQAKTFASYEGKLGNPELFKKAISLYKVLLINEEKIRIYANLKKDIALEEGTVLDFLSRVEKFDGKLTDQMAYFKPELSKLTDTQLEQYMSFKETKPYEDMIAGIIYDRQSVLSESEDRLLGIIGDLNQTFENNYQAFWNRYDVALKPDAYDDYYSSNDDSRYEATKASQQKEMDAIEILASNLEGKVKYDNLTAKAYSYETALEMVLEQDGITKEEYSAYEKTTEKNLALYHRWIAIKKRMLNLERPYKRHDMQLALLANEQEFTFEQAVKAVRTSLEPLGSEYLAVYDEAMDKRWVDVYPREGKYTGSYTWGAYASHPYVLINYENQFVNASTFAHEMGHAANGYFSAKNQPFNTFENGIFKAEIASTTNEVLFLESQLKLQQGEARQEILIQYIDLIVGTIFEQMKASEFEKLIHEAQADGKDLDGEFLVETWKNLNVKYYGKDYEASDLDGYEWTNIDHLYWNFYMYKYATGLASGYNIAMNLIEDPEKIRGKYMAFLKSGNSLDTLSELDGMKIKLSDGAALESCYKRLSELMDELESTLE